MTNSIPMPSPRGTNHERLFISAHRGPAYDARGGLLGYDAQPEPSPAAKVAKILVDCLSQDELNDLGREVVKARDASLDPYATNAVPASQIKRERNSGGSAMDSKRRRQIAMDVKWASALKGAFARPGTPTYDQRERRKLAADAATMKSLEVRFPDIAKIVVHAEEVDRHARPHRLATDGKINASLEERYPDLKKIGFAS
jgi:hypothetical protein